MLFKRRHKLPTGKKLRNWLWPERGIARALDYWTHRLARLPGSAHAIAAGFASGAAMSFTPFLGLHVLLSLGLVFIVRGNYFAGIVGTVIGNPWTFPFIFALIYGLGAWMLGIDTAIQMPSFEWAMLNEHFTDTFKNLFYPMLLGSFPVVIVVWSLVYFPLRRFLVGYKDRRNAKKMKKIQAQAQALVEEVKANDE